jgi:hypothetical protein
MCGQLNSAQFNSYIIPPLPLSTLHCIPSLVTCPGVPIDSHHSLPETRLHHAQLQRLPLPPQRVVVRGHERGALGGIHLSEVVVVGNRGQQVVYSVAYKGSAVQCSAVQGSSVQCSACRAKRRINNGSVAKIKNICLNTNIYVTTPTKYLAQYNIQKTNTYRQTY